MGTGDVMKYEHWMFHFQGDDTVYGPIDSGKPVTEKEIRKYIRKRFETTLPFEVWGVEAWWTP